MSAAIFTLNVGDYLCDNVRSSHTHAAHRWKADYIEITSVSLLPGYHPCYGKPEIVRHRLSGYDRVLFLDGDTLVRVDAPSPFRLYPISTKWYAVNDHQSHYALNDPAFGDEVLNNVISAKIAMTEQRIGCSYRTDKSRFFNAGVWLCSPRYHAPVFDYFLKHIPEPNFDGHLEQALLNIAVDQTCRESLVIIPEKWNRISPPRENPMADHFICHFTGNRRDELREIMKTCRWA